MALKVLTGCSLLFMSVAVAAEWVGSPADYADNTIGTDRSHGSCILGPSVPRGSVHPSPDSKWPMDHPRPAGAQHGYGAPTSGWWPGDPVVGFSQLHAQGTGGTPSYGIFRYVCPPSSMKVIEARPYLLKVKLEDGKVDAEVAATEHGAIYRFKRNDGTIVDYPLDSRCKLGGIADCVNGKGEFTGNWNPAPYRCYAWSEVDVTQGIYRISVSFASQERAKEYFVRELAGKTVEQVSSAARARWNDVLSRIEVDGIGEAEKRKFYSHLMQCFVQPRDRTSDGIGWDDHYTMWDSWRTSFPLMALIDPASYAGNVNSFADRFAKTGRCEACYTQGKEFKTGQGGDEADYIIADAWARKVPGIDWKRVRPILESRWTGRTRGYRENGYVPVGEHEDYCGRMKGGSATMSFAYQDWCCGRVLGSRKFLDRSCNWTNIWDATLTDVPSGVKGFIHARKADGSFGATQPRQGFNTDFYEATCWEYSFIVPHDMDRLIQYCGGKDAFVHRLEYALDNKLIEFGNEPSFQTPWLFAYAGRSDLVVKWAREVQKLFEGDAYPGDCDGGAMSSFCVFLRLGFYPIAGQDIYVLHGSAYPRIRVKLPATGKVLTIVSENLSPENAKLKAVLLNGKPHDMLFLHHSEIVNGGELRFVCGK